MNKDLRNDVFLSVARALWGEVFPGLRAVTGAIASDHSFTIAFYVHGQIADDDEESISFVVTEVIADFQPNFEISHVVTRLDSPAKVPAEDGFLIYMRKEPMSGTEISDPKRLQQRPKAGD